MLETYIISYFINNSSTSPLCNGTVTPLYSKLPHATFIKREFLCQKNGIFMSEKGIFISEKGNSYFRKREFLYQKKDTYSNFQSRGHIPWKQANVVRNFWSCTISIKYRICIRKACFNTSRPYKDKISQRVYIYIYNQPRTFRCTIPHQCSHIYIYIYIYIYITLFNTQ